MSSSLGQTNQQAMDSFGTRITVRLNDSVQNLPYEISERLRASRVQAVDKRKWVLAQSASGFFINGHVGVLSSGHNGEHSSWWNRLGAVGLLLTLVLGLFAINIIQDELRIRELVDIDSALLTDDLPPAAYIDPGFAQFLKSGNRPD
jgi:hypothetical protein